MTCSGLARRPSGRGRLRPQKQSRHSALNMLNIRGSALVLVAELAVQAEGAIAGPCKKAHWAGASLSGAMAAAGAVRAGRLCLLRH